MSDRGHDLVDGYDIGPELIEGLPWRYGTDIDVPEPDQFCAASGTDKRAAYYHILGSLELNLDLSR